MNKAELIDAIAAKAGMTKVDSKKALDAMIAVAKAEMKKDGKIALVGFGTLATTVRPARKGHNPRTGKSIKIAAKKVVKFKPAANILK
ncbi:MAG: HU family DNA-binding protein [Bacteroidales bacterium]|jgi:DNA-binding protein HU-beta|nr:HU family DNA-binding protein [Bacteroidales bacterium]